MIVYLLTIEHRHGTDNWVCSTEEVALANLDAYVRTWWEEEMEEEKIPEDRDERIEAYFNHTEELGMHGTEYYHIEALPVLDKVEVDA